MFNQAFTQGMKLSMGDLIPVEIPGWHTQVLFISMKNYKQTHKHTHTHTSNVFTTIIKKYFERQLRHKTPVPCYDLETACLLEP